MSDLSELHRKYRPTKYREYMPYFERHLAPVRHSATKILEIGAHYGASLAMWRDYFPNTWIYSIDHEDHMTIESRDRITLFVGDQADRDFLLNVVRECGELDFVNDDGGHKNFQQQESFKMLWPIVKSGGIYIIEDLGTSYRDEFLAPNALPTTEFLYDLVDEMNHSGYIPERPTGKNSHNIRGIYFYEWMCVLEKA